MPVVRDWPDPPVPGLPPVAELPQLDQTLPPDPAAEFIKLLKNTACFNEGFKYLYNAEYKNKVVYPSQL